MTLAEAIDSLADALQSIRDQTPHEMAKTLPLLESSARLLAAQAAERGL